MNKLSQKTNIYFLRHGKIENPNNIWYGRLAHFPLSDKGRQEIEKVSKYLSNKHIFAIYSSPLLRAKQSAQIIAKNLGLHKIHYSKNILEVDSSFQGKPLSKLNKIHFEVYATKHNNVKGETIEELSSRMQKFISHVVKLFRGKNIAVVSHGDPIMMVKAVNENLPIEIESIRKNANGYIQTGGIYLLKI